jgi:hypothetical protein
MKLGGCWPVLAVALVLGAHGSAAFSQSAVTSPALSTEVAPPDSAAPLPLGYDDLLQDNEPPSRPPASTGPTSVAAPPDAVSVPDLPPPATAPLVTPQPVAAALPSGSGVLDSATVQRIVDRLVAMHFLYAAADAQDADALTQAIRDFQESAGISPTGTLDRDTIGRLTTP